MKASDTATAYVTTPIYYVNDRPHIGHVYTTAIADVVARYHRLRGDDTFFLTGTDEHATKVVDAAAERGITPLQCADENSAAFQETFARLELTNDDFIRTTQARHTEKVTTYFRALLDSGDVYLGDYEGWYDAGQEEYVTESDAKANDYLSATNRKPLVKKKEKNYFFRLSAYREPLESLFAERDEAGQPFVRPAARKKEILNRIAEAEDVPISRTGVSGWGVPVPGDEDHTIYVWIDALFNYLTTVDTNDRRHYWQSGATHFIAKDILWFHAAIWPAVLMALRKSPGYEWVNQPAQVYSHSYWVAEGIKMSKTLGNFVDLARIEQYVERFGLDALRWFLATRGPLGTADSNFAESAFVEAYNADLANTFGNCFSRVSNMTAKYFEGKLPAEGAPVETAAKVANAATDAVAAYRTAFERRKLDRAADAALGLVRSVDAYIEETAPFKLAKDPASLPQVATILNHCAEALRIASVLLWPFLPDACEKVWARLGLDYGERVADRGRGDLDAWCAWGLLEPGTPIEKGEALFQRYRPPEG